LSQPVETLALNRFNGGKREKNPNGREIITSSGYGVADFPIDTGSQERTQLVTGKIKRTPLRFANGLRGTQNHEKSYK